MLKVLGCGAVLVVAATLLNAEPLVLRQATNVLDKSTLELGIGNFTYQSDETKFLNSSGAETSATYTKTGTLIPVFARYGFTRTVEGTLLIPYRSSVIKNEQSGTSLTAADSGLGDVDAGIKVNVLDSEWKAGVGGNISLPVGDKKFREGFAIAPLVAVSRSYKEITFNANLSYAISGEYEAEDAEKTKTDPADILTFGIGAEYPVKAYKGLNAIGEFIYQNLTETVKAGVSQSGTAGSRMDLALGARYNAGSLKTTVGLLCALGDEKYRDYDYKLLFGLTYLLKV